jgi:hypothetical protein
MQACFKSSQAAVKDSAKYIKGLMQLDTRLKGGIINGDI